jgi:membrane-bound lytic murein transglycosylase F
LCGFIYLLAPELLLAEEIPPSTNQSPRVAQQIGKSLTTGNLLTAKQPAFDLDKIMQRGTLRIIVPSNLSGGMFLPRSDSPISEQQNLAQDFARSLGLKPEIVPILSFKGMLPALNAGRGDIVIANITVTEERKTKIAFSVPVSHAHQVVLVAKTAKEINITKDLEGKKLLINPSTAFWQTGLDYKKRYPAINLVKRPPRLLDEEALNLVATGKYDATIRDSNIAEMYLSYRDDLRIAFNASGEQSLAWGLRQNTPQLKKVLDQYLSKAQLAKYQSQKTFGDLDEIKKRGTLRILLRNNAASYFLWRGQLMGFEYEMAQAFAKHLGVRLVVLVPPDNDVALEWLENGKVDLAAGFLKKTPKWKERGIAASLPYHQAFEHVVVHKNNNKIQSAADLDGKTIVVHKSSNYWEELEELKQLGLNIKLQAAPEDLEPEEIIDKVAKGEYEMTLVDDHFLGIELANNVPVKSAFTFGDQKDHQIAVRGEDSRLLSALDDYIKSKKDGKLYSRLYAKYFTDSKQIRRLQQAQLKTVDGKKMISRFDPLVQRYAPKYGFDWRFISAQMFQESRFDPDARSHAGAIGLMQLMPATAKQLGISKIKHPENNVHAGTKYMNWLYEKFEPELPVVDRMWFTLAAYNAGLGHVLDARILAKQQGLNGDRWFGNVEKAMLLLSKPKFAKKARFGYVRGREPVAYVRSIVKLYSSYLNITGLGEEISEKGISQMVDLILAEKDLEEINLDLKQLISQLDADLENHPACCR